MDKSFGIQVNKIIFPENVYQKYLIVFLFRTLPLIKEKV